MSGLMDSWILIPSAFPLSPSRLSQQLPRDPVVPNLRYGEDGSTRRVAHSPGDPPDGASLEATAAGEGHRGDGDAITFDSPPPFLVVSSAGCASVNGRYAHDGLGPAGKVKYKKVDGDPVIYFSRGDEEHRTRSLFFLELPTAFICQKT